MATNITTKILPFSETEGQFVELWHKTDRCVARLRVELHDDAVGEQDVEKCARSVARWVVRAFDALSEQIDPFN